MINKIKLFLLPDHTKADGETQRDYKRVTGISGFYYDEQALPNNVAVSPAFWDRHILILLSSDGIDRLGYLFIYLFVYWFTAFTFYLGRKR